MFILIINKQKKVEISFSTVEKIGIKEGLHDFYFCSATLEMQP